MFLKPKTQITILLALLVFIINYLGIKDYSLTNNLRDINKELINLNNEIEKKDKLIEELETEVKNSNNLSKELEDNYNKLLEDYNILKGDYEEEIKPISFNPLNLWEKSNATEGKMKKALKDTNLSEVSHVYIEAERIWGVNAIFLASLTAEESGWGSSHRALNQNNLSGFGVYSTGSEGVTFSSWEESIMKTAELICNNYLKSEGIYHNGITIYDVNISYCPNDGGKWSENISNIAFELVEKVNSF